MTTVHFYRLYFGYRRCARGFTELGASLALDMKDECETRGPELSVILFKYVLYIGFDLEYEEVMPPAG